MADPSWALQQAVYAAVTAAVAPIAVHDHPPQESAFPYFTIGEAAGYYDGTKTEDGQEVTVNVHAWSRYRGRKEVKELLGKVYDALHEKPLTVPGFNVSLVRFEFGDSALDEDGLTYHGVHRYRIFIQPA